MKSAYLLGIVTVIALAYSSDIVRKCLHFSHFFFRQLPFIPRLWQAQ